jgi:hypothetical protein
MALATQPEISTSGSDDLDGPLAIIQGLTNFFTLDLSSAGPRQS